MAMKTSVLLWAAVCTAAVAQANPLDFAEWTQTVEAVFATSADAAKAELRCLDLPKGMTRAFGCRWDDANALHAAKGEMMTRAGVKGTFFLNGDSLLSDLFRISSQIDKVMRAMPKVIV